MDSFIVQGNLDSLSVIREKLLKLAETAGLGKDASYKLALAVDEIATNIIIHGYQEHNTAGDITMTTEVKGSDFISVLEDTAPAYDPRTRKLPGQADLEKPLEEREIGGLGVFLVMQNVDKFDYEYRNGRNRNIFVMKRGKDTTR
jgi:serine/threonine-protein kinase RsbW